MSVREKAVWGSKLYLKRLLNFGWGGYAISLFNFILVVTLFAYVFSEHAANDRAAVEAVELLANAFYVLLALPFVSIAIAMVAGVVAKRLGYDLSRELWPEVSLYE